MERGIAMRTSKPLRLGVAALLAGLALAGITPAGAQQPAPAPAAPAQASSLPPALSSLAACVQGSKSLNVVFLVDESASLKTGGSGKPGTDPFDQRVAAGQTALDGLGKLVERSNGKSGKLDVNVLLAGFSVDYVQRAAWRKIDGTGAAAASKSDLEGFRDRDGGLDTDYHNALQGALESLQQRSAERAADSKPPCNAILWFTDGSYSVEDRTSPARRLKGVDGRGVWNNKEYAQDIDLTKLGGGARTVFRGLELVCRPDGLADKLRQSNTTLLAVALTSGGPDTSWLNSIVSGGSASAPPCGAVDGRNSGQVFPATDVGSLFPAFDEIVQGLGNPASTQAAETGVCPATEESCPRGTKSFEVDGALQRFHLLAQTDAPGIALVVQPPTGESVKIAPKGSGAANGSKNLPGSSLTWSWISGTALTLDAEAGKDPAGWAGTWSVTFVDTTGQHPQAVVKARIFLFGDVLPSLTTKTFRAGELNSFKVAVIRAEGTPVPAQGLKGTITIDGDVTDPATTTSVAVEKLKPVGNEWVGTYRAPDDIESPSVNLTLRLTLVTASGITLPPSAASFPVTVLPPKGFPELGVDRLNAGTIEGLGDDNKGAEINVPVKGSDKSASCVWLDGSKINTPAGERQNLKVVADGAGTTEKNCLKVGKGGQGVLALRAQPTTPARLLETGTVRVGLRSANDNEARFVELPLTAQLVKPANKSVVAGLLALLLLAGIGIPFLILYLTNVFLAKFAPTGLMESGEVGVRVSDRGVEREDGGDGMPFAWEDFIAVGGSRDRSKSFTTRGVTFTAKVSPNPFIPPVGRADTADPSFGSHRSRSVKGNAVIPLWVSNEWMFEAQSVADDGTIEGRLIGFVLATEKPAGLQRLNANVRDTLPGLREAAVRAIEAERQAAEKAAQERARKLPKEVQVPAGTGAGQGIWSAGSDPGSTTSFDSPFDSSAPTTSMGSDTVVANPPGSPFDSPTRPMSDDAPPPQSPQDPPPDKSIWD